jgi:AraC-like DNA-binding protein
MPSLPHACAIDLSAESAWDGRDETPEQPDFHDAGDDASLGVIDWVTADLRRNFSDQISLEDMGKATGYSVYQLIRMFRRDLGMTPHAYLMRLRIDHAAARLAKGDTIAGAAAEAGFADQSHMTRHFKRVFGTTPGGFLRDLETVPASPR